MRLSIITVNYNNASGLRRTLESVVYQTSREFEYIIIDGSSTDDSVEIIHEFQSLFFSSSSEPIPFQWISEPDKGIYHAMNKGIRMAQGEYVQFLNSGDCLANNRVVETMMKELSGGKESGVPVILYGNLLKQMQKGIWRDRCFAGKDISFLGMFTGTLNHSSTYIRRNLFDKYGLYDEGLRIASDWKWFLKVIILGEERPLYADIDVTIFDMNGISSTNRGMSKAEREQVLKEMFPLVIIADYEKWAFPISQMKRLMRFKWIHKFVWFIERCLFKYEQWFVNKEQVYK
jgi:glycosyltransferase involved in cell wall biosynthesis